MITQAIKRWLQKLFGWLSGRRTAERQYAQVVSPLSTSMSQESRPAIDGAMPPSGVAPLIVNQGETSCSTIDEWPERVMQPPPPPVAGDKVELPPPSAAIPPLAETAAKEPPAAKPKEEELPPAPPRPAPTLEQKLDFLHYLVRRGIVNEGFAEGQIPEQYRKK